MLGDKENFGKMALPPVYNISPEEAKRDYWREITNKYMQKFKNI